MCLDGDGRINYGAVEALKTHVSMQEALELEAVACEAGDRRHEFQQFYPEWLKQEREASKDLSTLGQLDPARVLEEIEMTRQAIDQHEGLLAVHREAVIDGRPSPYSDANVDGIHATLESLRNNLPAMEAEYARLTKQAHPDGGKLPTLQAVGPVQSGTLRPFGEGR